MKILYNNLLESTTLTATNENGSYPITNTTHKYLEKKFMATTTTSTITLSLAMSADVSAIAIGWHNLSSGTYILKDSGGSTVGSGSLAVAEETDITYFTAITCKTIELSVVSADIVRIGGLGVGNPTHFLYHNTNPIIDYYDNDSSSFTAGGQLNGKKTATLLRYTAVLGKITNAQRKEVMDIIKSRGSIKPVYADLYALKHEEARPIYCRLAGNGAFKRQSDSYDYTYTVVMEEVK